MENQQQNKTKTEEIRGYLNKYQVRRGIAAGVIAAILITVLLLIIFSGGDKKTPDASVSPTPTFGLTLITPKPTVEPSAVPANKTSQKPRILIYHTHTDESFLKGAQTYKECGKGRTLNENYNVCKVGKTLKENLESRGFSVIQDTTDHDSFDFNNAYSYSLKTMEKYADRVDFYLDLHRDAYAQGSQKTLAANGKKYAYICFVVASGTDYDILPRTEACTKLAQKFTDTLNEICPGICKKVIFKPKARYNQHVSDQCLLVEIGTEENTLEEVCASTELLAQAFEILYE